MCGVAAGAVRSRVRRPDHVCDRSSQPVAEVENEWSFAFVACSQGPSPLMNWGARPVTVPRAGDRGIVV
jgi:hypothetical protein